MKKTLCYFLIFSVSYISFGQVYPDDLTITSQAQIDSFNYTQVTGTLTIDESTSGNINNLDGLSTLTIINGGLSIANNSSLNSLNGLNNLISIGSGPIDFFGYGIGLNIKNNNSLTTISALSSLASIGSNLTIVNNSSLVNLTGLEGITILTGNFGVSHNTNLTSLNGLNNLTTVNGIGFFGGSFSINECNSLTTLEGLDNLATVDASFYISSNAALTSLVGLNSLNTITWDISIGNNDSLETLNGLQNLIDINASLNISMNNALVSLNGLDNLETIGGSLQILSNTSLTSLEGLEELNTIGHFVQIGNVIDGVSGFIYPGNISLTSLNLNNLTSIGNGFGNGNGGFFTLTGCNSLTTLDGLENLHTIEPEDYYTTDVRLEIGSNETNPNIYPISNLYNPQLSDFCGIKRLITYGEITASTSIIANNAYNPTISEIESLTCTLPPPSQTVFKWRTATNNGTTITETINGVTVTFTGTNPVILDVSGFPAGSYIGGGTDNVIQASSNSNGNVSFNFSEPVDIISIMASNGNFYDTHTFTPTGGNNDVVITTRYASGTVFLNWEGITSFSVSNITSYFGFDDLRTSPNTALSNVEYVAKETGAFPNPVEDFLYLENAENIQSIKVYNTLGQLILETQEKIISFRNVNQGLYLVQLYTTEGVTTKRVIKK